MKGPNVPDNSDARPGWPGSTTSSLLQLVQAHDAKGWQRLVSLYGPLVYSWSRQTGLQAEDAADVVQDVFRSVAQHIGTFHRNSGGFRAWLRTITRNKVTDHWRRRGGQAHAAGGSEAQRLLLEVPADESTSDYRPSEIGAVFHQAMRLIRSEFEEKSWKSFWAVTVEGRPAATVAAELGMSLNALYIAKSRILQRLRQEFGDLIE